MVKSNKRRDDDRRSAAAAKVAEMQRAQQAAERRRRTLIVSAIAVAAIVVIVGGFILYQASQSSKTVAAGGVAGSTGDYGFVLGKPSAPASMVVYEDFQCPVCKSFEDLDAATMQKYVDDGTLKVEYRPVAILDRSSTTEYSTRALNAAACVSNATDVATWKKFHDLLYANQPPEQTAGLTDDQLVTYATQAGAGSAAVGTCIKDRTFGDWSSSATEAFSKAGLSGTPTVQLNGQTVDNSTLSSADTFGQAIEAAASKG